MYLSKTCNQNILIKKLGKKMNVENLTLKRMHADNFVSLSSQPHSQIGKYIPQGDLTQSKLKLLLRVFLNDNDGTFVMA